MHSKEYLHNAYWMQIDRICISVREFVYLLRQLPLLIFCALHVSSHVLYSVRKKIIRRRIFSDLPEKRNILLFTYILMCVCTVYVSNSLWLAIEILINFDIMHNSDLFLLLPRSSLSVWLVLLSCMCNENSYIKPM